MARRWYTALGVNLLLGIPGVVPLWMLWYLAANWPLADLGLTGREPTENDGIMPGLLLFGPVVLLYAVLWWAANRPLAARTALTARGYWLLSVLATFLPTAALVVNS
ncbi:hypothetical protein PV703_15460 [Streptomyces sp. ME01-24h]|nr:hypothetical protein [Streptomyces sp. ME19-03-3]MDX3354680.1 hypothetical protein [Streptomyces sp. ME01-24h]